MNPIDRLAVCFGRPVGPVTGSQWLAEGNWEDLIRTAEKEVLLPALQGRLQELGILGQLPDEMKEFLSIVEELNLERNETIFSELAAVASLLNQHKIEPVLLKGAAYWLSGVYANLADRYMWDIDLLVPKPQLLTAINILSQNAFESDPHDRLGHFRHHHPPLRRKGSVGFELHHNLGMGICRSLLPASEVLEQSSLVDFRGTRVRLPCPEHLMSHLIMHSQIQHRYSERIWPPLRAMYDLALLRRRFENEIDWSVVERRYGKVGQFGVLALHLLQVQGVLGLAPPFPIHLTGLLRLRWLRRRLLRASQPLRFLDPIYMCSTVFRTRLRLLQTALDVPGGWQHVAKELFAPAFYKRFLTDVIENPGR